MAAVNSRKIYLTNSKTHKKEEFIPLESGKVKMYSCGPTVYGPIHIGNLRAALTADMFYRFFKKFGYQVTYVRNYTDIDDRILKNAIEQKVPTEAITKKFIEQAEKDYALAGLEQPTHKTLVTEHLPEINTMIQKIIDNGFAYVAKDGEVFFEISKFKSYGALSRKPLEDLMAGARVEVNPNKRNPMDFSLWKPAKPGEQTWDSPWGKGHPGWHIECSAMASKWLGDTMDLHHGGEDLIFPHHENEIAQSEAASGKAPYVRYWVHNAFLNFSNEKMSRSLGNVVNAMDFLGQYGGEVARMVILAFHYRSIIDFGPASVDQALTNLERIYEAKKVAQELREKKMSVPDQKAEQVWGGFMIDCDRTRNAIMDHYANDLNTAGAMSEIFTLVREWNRCLKEPNAANTPTAIIAANEFIKVMEEEIGSVIGLCRADASSMLARIQEIRALRQKNEGGTVLSDAEIQALLDERKAVRAAKNFKRSDEIRDILAKANIEIKDSPAGTTFTRK